MSRQPNCCVTLCFSSATSHFLQRLGPPALLLKFPQHEKGNQLSPSSQAATGIILALLKATGV